MVPSTTPPSAPSIVKRTTSCRSTAINRPGLRRLNKGNDLVVLFVELRDLARCSLTSASNGLDPVLQVLSQVGRRETGAEHDPDGQSEKDRDDRDKQVAKIDHPKTAVLIESQAIVNCVQKSASWARKRSERRITIS